MAEYRIVSRLDPQTSAGTAKVKQDLRSIQTEAKATEAALSRSFDQQKFEQTIGGLVNRLGTLDKTLSGLASSQSTLQRSNETLGQSLDRLASAGVRANAATKEGAAETDRNASSQARLEAALRRVLQATDQEAAEQARLNALLADAKRLLDAGMISQERYAQVQKLAAEAGRVQAGVSGQQRAGLQQLGYQIGDVATMYSLGARPAQIFASQIGQITQAVQLAAGGTSKWAAFLGGPWGIAISTAVILLAPFVSKLFESGDALDQSIEKMRKDAAETELNRKAKEAFGKTLEGQIALQRELNAELEKGIQSQRQQQRASLRNAEDSLKALRDQRTKAQDDLTKAQARVARLEEQLRAPPLGADESFMQGLLLALQRASAEVARLKGDIANAGTAINQAERSIRAARVPIQEDEAKAAVDGIAGINRQYDLMRDAAVEAAVGNERLSLALGGTLANIERQRKKALETADAQKKLATATTAATFRSQQQAIGVAGREFQRAGLRVSENSQFGGVTPGAHRGAGHRNGSAIDVDVPNAVDSAPTPPDILRKYDAVARRYAARGYVVLWAGKRYAPDGSVTPIKGGDMHYGHMHVEAPGTIVGKATQASTEAQAVREERAAETASDFVQGIVDRQSAVGLPATAQGKINTQVDQALAEFKRRFDREATAGEKATITKAFTDPEARETAQRFDDAYVKPLARLKALQGATGIERDILNQKLEETERLGRALTPVEEKMIENSIRDGDALQRKARILEEVRAPLEEYKAQIKALNELLAAGSINQTQYNARIAEIGRTAAASMQGIGGVDPNTGKSYDDLQAISDENARYAKQLEDLQNSREQLLQMGISYDALEEAARRQHNENLAKIDQARKDVQVGAAEDIFGSLTSIAEATLGKQSAAYKAMFAMEKAVAIARSIMAIQTGIAQAAALPFPANLPAIASVVAATASIISNIQSVALNFADGGYVSGPGGPRDDRVRANLSDGEFVVNADATRRNRALLEAINSGSSISEARAAQGAASLESGQRSRVTVQQHPGVAVEVRESLTTGDVEIIAARVVDRRAGDVFAREVARPNSRVSKAIQRNTTAKGRKT